MGVKSANPDTLSCMPSNLNCTLTWHTQQQNRRSVKQISHIRPFVDWSNIHFIFIRRDLDPVHRLHSCLSTCLHYLTQPPQPAAPPFGCKNKPRNSILGHLVFNHTRTDQSVLLIVDRRLLLLLLIINIPPSAAIVPHFLYLFSLVGILVRETCVNIYLFACSLCPIGN